MKGAHSLTSGLDNLCDEGGRANAEDIVSFKNKKKSNVKTKQSPRKIVG